MADSNRWDGYDRALYQTPLYRVWSNMKTRCGNKNSLDYRRYGARGIAVCRDWNSFSGFYADMGSTHKIGLTLERRDNGAGYNKSNCLWVDRTTQANNRRGNKVIMLNGETKTLAQWIKSSSIKSSTIRQRFYVYGWPIERALGQGVCHR